ncbi:hypothetical protein VNO77_46303 [Canavalia gladiata]|uniref:Uncharacterized protein n=1 Tax=Canavalia gladiata TaxID=3824 RepID=A0AAN9JH11_CANGL
MERCSFSCPFANIQKTRLLTLMKALLTEQLGSSLAQLGEAPNGNRVLSLKQGDILPLTSDLTPDFLFPIPRKREDAPVGSGDMNRMSIRMSRNMDNVVVRAGREYEITDRRLFH